jgi:hypothetical protein
MFHFQPSEIMGMTLDDLFFWHRGMAQVAEWLKSTR